jgi:hypothetical protein
VPFGPLAGNWRFAAQRPGFTDRRPVLRPEGLKHRFRLSEAHGVQPFSEPVIDRCQQSLGCVAATLGDPQPSKAQSQPELPEQCVLLAGHFHPSIEAIFDPRVIRVAQRDQLALNPIRFRYKPSVTRIGRETQRGVDLGETIIDAAKRAQSGGELNDGKRIELVIARFANSSEAAAKQIEPATGIGSRCREAASHAKPGGVVWAVSMDGRMVDEFVAVTFGNFQLTEAQENVGGGICQGNAKLGRVVYAACPFDRPDGRPRRGIQETSRQQTDRDLAGGDGGHIAGKPDHIPAAARDRILIDTPLHALDGFDVPDA